MLCRGAHAPFFSLLGSTGVFSPFPLAPHVSPLHDVINYNEQSELLIDGVMEKKVRKKVSAVHKRVSGVRKKTCAAAVQLLANHILEDYCM